MEFTNNEREKKRVKEKMQMTSLEPTEARMEDAEGGSSLWHQGKQPRVEDGDHIR